MIRAWNSKSKVERSLGKEPLLLFLTVSWLKIISLQVIFNKEISETAISCLQLLLWPKLKKGSAPSFKTVSK